MRAYQPLLQFVDAVWAGSEPFFSNKWFVRADAFAAAAQEFKAALSRDLHEDEALEQALAVFSAVEAMNTPCLLRRRFAWVNMDAFATLMDEIHVLIPKRLLTRRG